MTRLGSTSVPIILVITIIDVFVYVLSGPTL